MTIYTFQFSKSLAESLGIDYTETPNLSDQVLSEFNSADCISVPPVMSEEIKRAISEARKGQPAPNKGISNPKQKERFLTNNPMKNPESVSKMIASKKGKPSPFKITGTFNWTCSWCKKQHVSLDNKFNRRKKRPKVFCDKSCAASYSNTHRYTISQPPAAEQANS